MDDKTKTKPVTWKELEAQGVHRCCALFTNGKRCRRRVVAGTGAFGGAGFCEKHGKTIARAVKARDDADV